MKKTATAAAAPMVALEDHKNEPVPIEPSPSERVFLTTDELRRQILPLSRRSIFDLRKRGVLPSIEAGGKVLFHKESVVEALLRRQSNGHNGHA